MVLDIMQAFATFPAQLKYNFRPFLGRSFKFVLPFRENRFLPEFQHTAPQSFTSPFFINRNLWNHNLLSEMSSFHASMILAVFSKNFIIGF